MSNQDLLMSRPVSVVTPVISSLTGALRQYITSKFPKSYFKDFFIDTQIPAVQRGKRFRPMSRSQVSFKKMPMLSIRIEPDADSSDFSSGVSWWTGNQFLRDPTQLVTLINDDANLRYVGFSTERVVIRFQLSILVESDLKAREVAMYMKRTIPIGQRTYLNEVSIATEIPGDILRSIWQNMQLGDPSNSVAIEKFSKYLRSVTAGDVEQVINSSTGRVAFAFSYNANLLMNITSAPSVNITRDGSVVKYAQIDLPIEIDLAVPMSYAYRQESPAIPTDEDLNLEAKFGNSEGAYFGFTVRTRPPTTIEDNLGLAFFANIVTPSQDGKEIEDDISDLSEYVEPSVRAYIDELMKLPNASDLVKVKLWYNTKDVDPSGWKMDLASWVLTIKPSGFLRSQKYSIGVYCDLEAFQRLGFRENERPQAPSPYY